MFDADLPQDCDLGRNIYDSCFYENVRLMLLEISTITHLVLKSKVITSRSARYLLVLNIFLSYRMHVAFECSYHVSGATAIWSGKLSNLAISFYSHFHFELSSPDSESSVPFRQDMDYHCSYLNRMCLWTTQASPGKHDFSSQTCFRLLH